MPSEVIGRVRSSRGKSHQVKWNPRSREVYVDYAGWSRCGKAKTAAAAMRRAEAFLYDK